MFDLFELKIMPFLKPPSLKVNQNINDKVELGKFYLQRVRV